jgi:hypothetical protein
VTLKDPVELYVIACGPTVVAVCPLPKFQLYEVGPAKLFVVFVNRMVEPLQTLITPEVADGIVEKEDAFCPHDVMYVANARNTNHMLKKDLLNSR